MKKNLFTVALCAMGLTVSLALAGCGASLDRDVDVAGMTMSVPSDWQEKISDDNDEAKGTVAYEKYVEDTDDEAYTAIVVRYAQPSEGVAASADEAIALKRQQAEQEYGAINWIVDDKDTQIIDGAEVTTYEYSFEKEIDHVNKKYEYKAAYVFATGMTYEISVYGDDVAIADVVKSIEL